MVEQRALATGGRAASEASDQSRPQGPHTGGRAASDFVLQSRPAGRHRWSSSERSERSVETTRAAHRWSSSERSKRSVETTPTRSLTSPGFETGLRPSSTSGGYEASEVTGGRAARSRLGSTTKTRSVETTPTRSVASPGFETGLRPSSTSGWYRWSSSEVSTRLDHQDAISRDHPPCRPRQHRRQLLQDRPAVTTRTRTSHERPPVHLSKALTVTSHQGPKTMTANESSVAFVRRTARPLAASGCVLTQRCRGGAWQGSRPSGEPHRLLVVVRRERPPHQHPFSGLSAVLASVCGTQARQAGSSRKESSHV